jgi:hypothetical protein
MTQMIARPNDPTQRVFPPIGPDLYCPTAEPTDLTSDQRRARDLLRLADKDFTRWERLWGWKLDTAGKVGRLLLLHRTALAAELKGLWRRADFFWHHAHTVLRTLSREAGVWEGIVAAGAGEIDQTVMDDPERLRSHLVDEIFIDTHCALYNGRVRGPEKLTSDDRAFVHARYIAQIIDLSSVRGDERLSMLDGPMRMQIDLCEADKKWEQAIRVCTDMLGLFPDLWDYQSMLAGLSFSDTVSKLNKGTTSRKNLADAAVLDKGIRLLKKKREQYVYNVAFFEMLGHLYHLRAVKLANGQKLSDALVEVQKALLFNPYLEKAKETREELIEMMAKLQAHVQALESQLASRPNTTLSLEGLRLQAEARRGLGPLASYTKSTEAEQTVAAFRVAQAHSIWHEIGLARPEDRFDERALSLVDGLSQVIREPPTDKSGVGTAWDKIARQNPVLAELDAERIRGFLERRLFGGEPEQDTKGTYEVPAQAPLLEGASPKRWQKDEPFEYWFFSLRGMRIKIQAAAAVILLLVAGVLAVRESSHRRARTVAYQQIQAAADSKDYLGVVQGAEAFFSNPLLSGRDARETEIRELYDRAFVHWFVSQGNELDPEAAAHIGYRRTLIADTDR